MFNWNLLNRFTHTELIAAMWPRPVAIEWGRDDPTTTPEWHTLAWEDLKQKFIDPWGMADKVIDDKFIGPTPSMESEPSSSSIGGSVRNAPRVATMAAITSIIATGMSVPVSTDTPRTQASLSSRSYSTRKRNRPSEEDFTYRTELPI